MFQPRYRLFKCRTARLRLYGCNPLEIRHCTGQGVANIQVYGAVVGLLGSGRSVVPQSALQPLVLPREVDGAIAGVPPNGLIEPERDFIDRADLARSMVTVPFERRAVGIEYDVPADVNPTVVG